MHTLRLVPVFTSSVADISAIKTTYDGPYAEQDFNLSDAISFPLKSCFGYRAAGREIFPDDNSVLLERGQTEFTVRKFKPFCADTTLYVSLPAAPEIMCHLLPQHSWAALFRRTPGIETLLRCFLAANPGDACFREQIVADLLDAVFRIPAGDRYSGPGFDAYRKRRVEQAKDFIHDRHSDTLSIAEIAAAANTSPYHFSRLFRRATGFSPYDYLLRVRLEHAKALLRSGMPVGLTAYETGFNSPENFSLAFKKMTGSAPAHFQKRKIY